MTETITRKCLVFISALFSVCNTGAYAQQPMHAADTVLSLPGNRIENAESLKPFFDKLAHQKENGTKLSILHLGDSHVQMGYFIQEIRSCFAANWDLSGYGTIFPYQLAHYKPFYVNTKVISGKWEGSNYLNAETSYKFGVSGFTARTSDSDAVIELSLRNISSGIMGFDEVTIYYQAPPGTTVSVKGINSLVDSTLIQSAIPFGLPAETADNRGWTKDIFRFKSEKDRVLLSVKKPTGTGDFYLYSLQLDHSGRPGILYNNCSVGGAQFSNLINNSSYSLGQIQDLNPDLIIISYGTNESYTTSFKGDAFLDMVSNFIDSLKSKVPGSSILLTSPPDARARNRFPRNLDSIQLAYRFISQHKELAYWDLRTQMGGNGSIYKWHSNGLAANDYLHFTTDGYILQARMFMQALFDSYNSMEEEKNQVKPVIIIPKE